MAEERSAGGNATSPGLHTQVCGGGGVGWGGAGTGFIFGCFEGEVSNEGGSEDNKFFLKVKTDWRLSECEMNGVTRSKGESWGGAEWQKGEREEEEHVGGSGEEEEEEEEEQNGKNV